MGVDWDELRTILYVVRGKSLAAAAANLGVNYTTVARRIARAEKDLGQVLFDRRPDGYRATEAAELIASHASQMEVAEHGLMRDLNARDTTLSGPITITAPQLLIAHFLSPVIDEFCTSHPDVELRIRTSNDLLDLNKNEADLAIRISRDPGDAYTGLRLTGQHNANFAVPELAKEIADNPHNPIDWIVYDQFPDLPKTVLKAHPNSHVKLRFDDMVAMLGAAEAGLGVVRMPMFLGRSSGRLVQTTKVPPAPYADIWAVAHKDVWRSAKLVAFREVLVPYFRANRSVFVA